MGRLPREEEREGERAKGPTLSPFRLLEWVEEYYKMTLSVQEARLANVSTGRYLSRSFNIDPPERRMMPGMPVYRDMPERMRMGMDCDEVYPGIIIGTGPTVKNLKYLVKLGVTHVLNTAENDVNISPGRYAKEGIMYKGFRLPDLPQSDIYQHF